MRWLHTSDWHLGRGFHGNSLRADQEAMLTRITEAVDEHDVGLLLVSGDVYDRALPPEWAVAALEEFLAGMARRSVTVVITAGNHDSAQRLGFGRALMSSSGVHIRSALEDSWAPVELRTEQASGEGQLLIYGIPYAEPQLHARSLGLERANHTAVMQEILRRIGQDARQRRDGLPSSVTQSVVVMAHVFAAQGVASDSERPIGAAASTGERASHHEDSLGGLSVVPLELFAGFDYVALGHLHGRQRLTDRVRYSGSPLRYSFSETRQAKGAWLGETEDFAAAQALDWRIGRPLAQLSGPLEEILEEETIGRHRESYVQVRLTDPVRPERAFQRVQEAYPQLASFAHVGNGAPAASRTYSQRVAPAKTTGEVVSGFLEHVRGRLPSEQESALIDAALEQIRLAPLGAATADDAHPAPQPAGEGGRA